jgi:predicted esterase
VEKLIMLAPALILPPFAPFSGRKPVSVPTTIIHGTQDTLLPLERVQEIAKKVFTNLTYKVVDDDHSLHKTADALNWKEILSQK